MTRKPHYKGGRRGRRQTEPPDPAYREWVHSLPCLICFLGRYRYLFSGKISWEEFKLSVKREWYFQVSETNAHHAGDRGLGQSAPDRTCLPLCHKAHHQYGKEAIHVMGKKFWGFHDVDRDYFIEQFNQLYKQIRRSA